MTTYFMSDLVAHIYVTYEAHITQAPPVMATIGTN